ncbi:RNA exonuclease ngl2 [Dimargaris verticillata]|uniref:RNA exonuclease ngl2 n=1 Tax=Dimargaris verticillata TaxID=2761393 RepID=A0A9W8B776_9FUNG|nr:RNA exonuclease ngl2 [Dimargaris verticillata]
MPLPDTFASVLPRRLVPIVATGQAASVEAQLASVSLEQVHRSDWDPRSAIATHGEADATAFTVMTWNVLAQNLIKRDLFPYCTKSQLKWRSRKARLLAEFEFYRPDIACLQEVDKELWQSTWAPLLGTLGYAWRYYGYHTKRHGCCLAWKRQKWRCLDYSTVDLDASQRVGRLHLPTDNVAQVIALARRASHSCAPQSTTPSPAPTPSVVAADQTQPHHLSSDRCWQPDHQRSPQEQVLLVSNCHLYWSPYGDVCKLAQVAVIERALAQLQLRLRCTFPALMCGDFNSAPTSAVYQALRHTPDAISMDQLLQCFDADPKLRAIQYDASQEVYRSVALPDGPDEAMESVAHTTPSESSSPLTTAQRREIVGALLDACAACPKTVSAYSYYHSIDPAHYDSSPDSNDDPSHPYAIILYRPEQWHGEPRLSTYSRYQGLLDYMFVQNPVTLTSGSGASQAADSANGADQTRYTVRPTALLTLPPESALAPAIPNDAFASDHLSLLAEFQFD